MGLIQTEIPENGVAVASIPPATDQGTELPSPQGPNKRLKLSNGDHIPIRNSFPTYSETPAGYIVLSRILLDLKILDPAIQTGLNLDATTQRLPVLLKRVSGSGDEPDVSRLELQQSNQKKMIIRAETFSKSDTTDLTDRLSRVKSLGSVDAFRSILPTVCYQATLQVLPHEQHVRLEIKSLWKDSLELPGRLSSEAQRVLVDFYSHSGEQSRPSSHLPWSPREFYDNVHVPPNSAEESAEIRPDQLNCELYPFQKRAVRWLLRREGVALDADGRISPYSVQTADDALPKSFCKIRDADGKTCYVSKLFKIVSSDVSRWDDSGRSLKGGILAEEMGLGKTVEMITLMCLHSRVFSHHDGQLRLTKDGLLESRATLIITPPAILEQWKQEIESHAPSLSVFHYNGVHRHPEIAESSLAQVVADHDVVLTTYHVLAREVHYAGDGPQRNLRHEKRFEARKTPLVQISWWRVCLDEAQMIESGVSNAARVARLIPRKNAWAVTGTPIRKDIKDLFGLLLFLGYEPFCNYQDAWMAAYNEFRPVFQRIVKNIALRHSKDCIRSEIRLPPQKRVVITVPFTAIEEQHYSQLFEQMCDECELNLEGAPLNDEWDPDAASTVEKMRSWLARLRQTCLHPEVAKKNRRALGIGTGPLRTVSEVLEVMIDQNDSSVRAEERALLLSQLRRGQLLENASRRMEALALWQSCLERSTEIVQECRAQLEAEREKFRSTRATSNLDTASVDTTSDDESENNSRLGTFRLRLRAAIEVQHICKFFTANAYYQIKTDTKLTEPNSEHFKELEKKEIDAYEDAKQMRKEMLTDVARRVGKLMKIITQKIKSNTFVSIPEMKPRLFSYGLEGRRILERFEDYCEVLNKHANQYREWREVMIKLLTQSLIDEEDDIELEGNEYEASTKHQDEMYVYMEALRAMFADRHDAITGQSANILISHEVKMGIAQAKRGEGPSPELYLSVMNKRNDLKPDAKLGSLRGIVSELRSLATALEWQESGGSTRAAAELEIVRRVLEGASHMAMEQSKVSSSIEKEVEMFRDTMNHRLEYYRQLQQISDTVAPYDEESVGKPLDDALYASKLKSEEGIEARLSSLKAKRRYLIHLRGDSGLEDSTRICVICQCSFEIGVLTVCGHKYCKDCLRMWWNQHRTCPTCKKRLTYKDFHQITYKPQELLAKEEENLAKGAAHYSDQHTTNSIYSDITSGELQEIKNVDLDGSYGTKIDTLARHIIWLREHDPGSKSIIFSQYKNFLGILDAAFRRFKIKTTSVDAKRGIEDFKTDHTVECFLLHAKAHSSGLNLVNATHVFLCEPLINTAIELQAIARVHRIGQHRPTTVWMHLVSDTVEESIYDISVSRRLSHIVQKEKEKGVTSPEGEQNGISQLESLTETAIDSANSLEIRDANLAKLMSGGSSGGEMVKKDDLWQCLFGSAKKKKSSSASSAEAEREVGRFLRGEAAELRKKVQE